MSFTLNLGDVHAHVVHGLMMLGQQVRMEYRDTGIPFLELIVLALILLVVVVAFYLNRKVTKPFTLRASSSSPPRAAIERLAELYAIAGWHPVILSDRRAIFTRLTVPNALTVLVLGIFFILPALIYMALSFHRQMASLTVTPDDRGGSSLEMTGNMSGWDGILTAATLMRELPGAETNAELAAHSL